MFSNRNKITVPFSTYSGKQYRKRKNRKTSIFTPNRYGQNMETFIENSEKRWDANHPPWDRIDSIFLSTRARAISGTVRVHSTSPAQLSEYIKYFINDDIQIRKLVYDITRSQKINMIQDIFSFLYFKAYVFLFLSVFVPCKNSW